MKVVCSFVCLCLVTNQLRHAVFQLFLGQEINSVKVGTVKVMGGETDKSSSPL